MTADPPLETLVIGVDAACQRVLDPLFRRDCLPNLRSIVATGTATRLRSELPPWTPSAWPSMYTGTNPGKHGVFSFLAYEGYDWDVVDATAIREPTLWELLDHHGLTSVVVNGPVTDPPAPIDGAVVPGFTAPEPPTCHPPGLHDDLTEALGGYRVYSNHEFDDDAPEGEKVTEYRRLVRLRGDAFCYLADRFEPDFGFVQFQQTDTVVHDFPGDWEKLQVVYEAVDEQVGRLVEACQPRTVILVSDHGIGEYSGVEFRVNEFLREEGYLRTTRGGPGMPSWVPLWEEFAATDGPDTDSRPSRIERGLDAAAALGVSAERVAAVVDRAGLNDVARRLAPDRLLSAAEVGEVVDFRRSTAYMRLPAELGVRINLAGREPDGVVAPDEYEAVRDELIDRLAAVETPNGVPVFERVVPREAVFAGPALEAAVDIVTVPNGFERFPSARIGCPRFGPLNEPWNHKRYGVLAIAHLDDRPVAPFKRARLVDVAPTVLAMYGLPRSDRMDGQVLPVVDPVGEDAYPAPDRRRRGPAEHDVVSRLESLGYL